MTISEFLNIAESSPINLVELDAFEKFYGVTLSDEAAKYFCALPNGDFLTAQNERFMHVLDSETILFANELISTSFAKHKVLPLIDMSDGVYLSYSQDGQCWGFFSIDDQCLFNASPSLPELFTKIA